MTLGRATWICLVRRATTAAGANVPLSAAVGALVVVTPVLLALGGKRAGTALAPVLDSTSAIGLVAPLAIAFAMAGAAVSLSAPDAAALDGQLRAAPVTSRTVVLALTATPLALASVLLLALACIALVPLASELRGGRPAALATAALCLAAVAAGAALAEAMLAVARRSRAGIAAAAALGLLALLDPLHPTARALVDGSATPGATARSIVGAGVAAGIWFALVIGRPAPVAGRPPRVLLGTPRSGGAAWFVCALKRYGRRRPLRWSTAAGVLLAFAGVGLLSVAGGARQSAVTLGAFTVLLGASVVPLAAHGLDRHALWLWLAVRRRPAVAVIGGALAAFVILTAAVAVVVAPLSLVTPTEAVGLGPTAVLTGTAAGLALVAGALVPWRGDRLVDQLASFGAFVGVLTAASFGVGAVSGPALRTLPEPVFAAFVVAVPFFLAVALACRSLRSER